MKETTNEEIHSVREELTLARIRLQDRRNMSKNKIALLMFRGCSSIFLTMLKDVLFLRNEVEEN